MERIYIEDRDFNSKNIADIKPGYTTYDNCIFTGCDLANTDLSSTHFMDCRFTTCNISNAKLQKTAFRNIIFKDCKMMGLLFDDCDDFLFEAGFENCVLNFSSFARRKMKHTRFDSCTIAEVNFTLADLTSAVFERCDLTGTKFENTILEKTDFRTAYNYSINPEINKLKKAKFSLQGLPGLLDKYDIVIEI
ncbi:MAG: pentapeptide repeat-containing protein [Agriterribacter sp.]